MIFLKKKLRTIERKGNQNLIVFHCIRIIAQNVFQISKIDDLKIILKLFQTKQNQLIAFLEVNYVLIYLLKVRSSREIKVLYNFRIIGFLFFCYSILLFQNIVQNFLFQMTGQSRMIMLNIQSNEYYSIRLSKHYQLNSVLSQHIQLIKLNNNLLTTQCTQRVHILIKRVLI